MGPLWEVERRLWTRARAWARVYRRRVKRPVDVRSRSRCRRRHQVETADPSSRRWSNCARIPHPARRRTPHRAARARRRSRTPHRPRAPGRSPTRGPNAAGMVRGPNGNPSPPSFARSWSRGFPSPLPVVESASTRIGRARSSPNGRRDTARHDTDGTAGARARAVQRCGTLRPWAASGRPEGTHTREARNTAPWRPYARPIVASTHRPPTRQRAHKRPPDGAVSSTRSTSAESGIVMG